MSGAKAKRPASYEDLQGLPESLVGEIIDGQLVASPRLAVRHAAASSALGVDLGSAFGRSGGSGPGRWVILDEPELHVAGQVLVPDLAVWRRERLPELPDARSSTSRPTGYARSSRRPRSPWTEPARPATTRGRP